ncbi:unnamed protein product [Mycena citricolor]|uniref:Integrase catalytic domain-containing protein n=1 Tax=Mycena citricolor TaxID=2018698 RepID=A0AAD2HU14_9AGAR|nr:unnamed protein product [Mycena citricolor]
MDGVLATNQGDHRLYRVNVTDEQPRPTVAIAGRDRNQPTTLENWHRRLGHSDVKVIQRMEAKNLVNGLNVVNGVLTGMCQDCILGKQDRMPFNDEVLHETEPLERVHLDLWGKSRTPSFGGAIYLFLISDGGTGMKFPVFIKETVLEAFSTWLVSAEVQTERKLKVVRVDLGSEFDNDLFMTFCRERGVTVERVPKASSSAHGHAERGNRTVIAGARTQLIESSLDPRFWAESTAAHCYVRSFIPSARHPDSVPWIRWFQKRDADGNLVKPNVSHLRVWGSICWVKDLDDIEGKLGRQGWEGRMVGYMGRRGYRIYDPKRLKVFEVRNVIFEEGDAHRTRGATGWTNGEDILSSKETPQVHEQVRDATLETTSKPSIRGQTSGEAAERAEPEIATRPTQMEVPELPRRSGRIPKPSRAVLESQMSGRIKEEARIAGEDWARDAVRPSANWVNIGDVYEEEDVYALAGVTKGTLPRSGNEAMKDPLWREPMAAEMRQMDEKRVWSLVDLPEGERAIDGMWVFDRKLDGEGNEIKRKARYVARGDQMIEGRDFGTKWAMVARMESVRMVFAVAAVNRLHVQQWDFSGAYLNGTMDRPVFMKQPRGFEKKGEEDKVCLLLRPIYGLVQAGHIWYKTLAAGYKQLNFHENAADPCVRTRKIGDSYTVTSTHTDDVIGASSTDVESKRVVEEFARIWDLKEVDVNLLLGLTVEKLPDGSISVCQRQYFDKVLDHFGFSDLPPLSTPLPPGYQVRASTSPLSPADAEFMANKPFRQILGSIVWGSSGTRPDLAYACCALGHVQANPNPEHWSLLIGVLRYIRGTMDYGIKYSPNAVGDGSGLKPMGYVDSDWAGCVDTRRSTAGYIFFMGGAPVAWSSKRQAVVALSSTEAEYISLARASQQAIWMKNWMAEVSLPQELPLKILGDNLGSISLTETTKGHGLAKHIDIRYHYIRDRVSEGEINVASVPGKSNVADIMTKALGKADHERICHALGLDWRRSDRQGEC